MVMTSLAQSANLGRVRLGYSGIRIYSGIYSVMEIRGLVSSATQARMRIAPKQTRTRIIPIILIPD